MRPSCIVCLKTAESWLVACGRLFIWGHMHRQATPGIHNKMCRTPQCKGRCDIDICWLPTYSAAHICCMPTKARSVSLNT